MYEKIHRRLCLLFAGITSLILIIMSVVFQLVSEKDSRDNSFLSFTGEMNTMLSNLETQTTITYEWLNKISDGEKYIIALYDNGTPLSYTTSVLTETQQNLAQEILAENQDAIETLAVLTESGYYGTVHREFQKQGYYICYSNIRRSAGTLSVLILYSTEKLESRFLRQRMLLLCMNLSGTLVLFLFSYFYTGRLLHPIQEAHNQQTSFIAAASHELRTPLSVILSCASALKYAESIEQESFFRTIDAEGARMSRLIDELLTLARSDSHSWSFQMKDIELDTLLLNVYESYKPLASKKTIELTLELPDEVFPACHCDSERITQVLEILLSNAISYGHENGHIRMRLAYRHPEFRLQVIDDGIGISPSAKRHIFERFFREDSSRSKKEHFGLGLSIAQEIIQAHHGRILVSDTPGGGTTFTMLLPLIC